jgi:pimeloyl-ACP methyl ester carboxylesterase
MERPVDAIPDAEPSAEPAGYTVEVAPGDRIHFLDWGGPDGDRSPGAVLIHGLSQTAWIWTPVARRLRGAVRTVAMDLRGHGLSDAPTDLGAYAPDILADDVVAVVEGSGLLHGPEGPADDGPGDRVVLVGHGFGAIVAAWAASRLGSRCAGLVLVDGGWERLDTATGLDVEEFLRGLDEPPEVMRSMAAFLADRKGFDPSTWDADQRRAAEATVVETHAGRVVPATRPHALEACVRTMFEYDPLTVLPAVDARIVALVADEMDGARLAPLEAASAARTAAGRGSTVVFHLGAIGHNLMRYRPGEVTGAILSLTRPTS